MDAGIVSCPSKVVSLTKGRFMARTGLGTSVITIILLFLGACHTVGSAGKVGSSPTTLQTRTTVVLGLYSGVPDPTWSLTVNEAKELTTLLAKLPRVAGKPPQGGLGYHGFTVNGPHGTLIAYKGAVATRAGGNGHLSDPKRTVERFLLETARTHVTRAEYAAAQQGIQ